MRTFEYPCFFASQARTLPPCYIGQNESGWNITGDVHEDHYRWVSEFSATHPDFGVVRGDFETKVQATSVAALNHFLKHHPYETWDYADI